jgi:hypothetical protein
MGRVNQEIERGYSDDFLLFVGETGEAVGKGVGNPDFYPSTLQRL